MKIGMANTFGTPARPVRTDCPSLAVDVRVVSAPATAAAVIGANNQLTKMPQSTLLATRDFLALCMLYLLAI